MPEDADKALLLLEQAIALEPDYAVVHAMIAWCHEQRYLRGGMLAETRAAASRHARAASRPAATTPRHWRWPALSLGLSSMTTRPRSTRLTGRWRSVPSSALALGFSSIIRASTDARCDLDRSCRDPESPQSVRSADLSALSRSCLRILLHRPVKKSLTAAGRAARANPRFSVPAVFQTAVLASLGRVDAAAAAPGTFSNLKPACRISQIASLSSNKARLAMLAEALRQAGLLRNRLSRLPSRNTALGGTNIRLGRPNSWRTMLVPSMSATRL